MIFCIFCGFCKVEGGQSERHSAPERCRYASVVACNAHHASHVKVFCRPLFWGAWRSSTPTCQPCVNPCHLLPERRRLWQPTSTRASRCVPAPPLSPSDHQLANVLRRVWGGFWGGFLERSFWGGFWEDFLMDFCWRFLSLSLRSPCKKIRKKKPHQNPH